MSSELGMILPFAFVMFVVWSVTRIIVARSRARRGKHDDTDARTGHGQRT
jgi:hypothetical protein